MIYDNKLHKKNEKLFFNICPHGGDLSKKFLPEVEFLNKKFSGPEDIPGGGMVTDTDQDDTCISVFLKLFLPGRYPIQLA